MIVNTYIFETEREGSLKITRGLKFIFYYPPPQNVFLNKKKILKT